MRSLGAVPAGRQQLLERAWLAASAWSPFREWSKEESTRLAVVRINNQALPMPRVVVIGASAGGPTAVRTVVNGFLTRDLLLKPRMRPARDRRRPGLARRTNGEKSA
jgi:hypothetical protein